MIHPRHILLGGMVAGTMMLASTSQARDFFIDIANDHVAYTKEAIKAGADVNAINPKDGQTPLTEAYRTDSKEVFDLLLQTPGIDLNKENSYGESPLMYPSLEGDLPRVKTMVEKGASVNKLGWSPIHYAVIKGRADVLEYLLSKGAWPNSPAPDGSSPLYYAAQTGNIKTAKILLAHGADPFAMNGEYHSAMDVAKARKNQKMIELFNTKAPKS